MRYRGWAIAVVVVGGCAQIIDVDKTYVLRDCIQAADDNDPCTLEGCEGEPDAHVITAGLPCGLNNDLTCTLAGYCGGCTAPDQCGTSTPCLPWVCDVDELCQQAPVPNGQPAQTQTPNDCKVVVCDGQGGEKTVNDDTDVPFYDCYMTTCSGGTEVKTPLAEGTTCSTNGGKSCDGQGTCVECNADVDCGQTGKFCDQQSHTCFRCDDNLQNGDETDVDCGGDRCSDCAQGKKCSSVQSCANGLFCADGVCCNSACDQPCEACNLPTSIGTCDFIAKYENDPIYGMNMSCLSENGKTCNDSGACRGTLGTPCVSATDCASTKCGLTTKVCVKNTGDECNASNECFSGMCVGGMCT